MRSFKQFLYRRKIKNVHAWLRDMVITSDEQLAAWCTHEGISSPEESFFLPEKKSEKVSTLAPKVEDGADAPWHTPAAERSRKASPKKKRTTKSSTSTKKRK